MEENRVTREPMLAGVLSFVFMGLGQAYNGQRRKGYLLVASQLGLALLYFILLKVFNEPFPKNKEISLNSPSYIITVIACICVWGFNIYDAYQTAKRLNQSAEATDLTPGKSTAIFIRNVCIFVPLTIIILVILVIFAAVLFKHKP